MNLSNSKTHTQGLLMLLLSGLLVVLWSAVAWNYSQSNTHAIAESRRRTDTLGSLFAQHTVATLRGVDHALIDLREVSIKRPAELQESVEAQLNFQGQVILQLAIINAQGLLTYSSLGMPKSSSFLGDREHFKVHQSGLQDKLFVSRPVKGRVSGKWSIQLSRPIFDKGRFVGVVVASVNPEYFVNFYAKAGLGKEGTASMVRDTGDLMLRSSKQDQYVGMVIKPSPYGDPGAPLEGNYRRRSQVDGVERLYSYVRLPDYGITVIIGPSVNEVMAPVKEQQRQIMLMAGVVTLLTLLMGWKLLDIMRLREAAQKALSESRERLSASHELLKKLSENVPGMIYQYRLSSDGQSTVPYASQGIQDTYGVSAAQVLESAEALLVNLHPDDQQAINSSIAESARTLLPWQHEYRVNHPHLGLRWLEGRAKPEKLADASIIWHGFVSDVTDKKKQEAALLSANQELETFSYSVSHDLRAPLNTITGFSQLLAKRLSGVNDEKVLSMLSRIQRATAQMNRLIEDLLVLAQVARLQMKCAPVDLSALAERVMDNLQAQQPDRKVAINIEAGLQTHGDTGLLQVVLDNLLGNAWKYSSKQEEIRISMGQQLDAQGKTIFFVRDNGAGFDMVYSEKLFQPFQRLHGVAEFPGSGIGLATVSRIIERHGGRIWADSAPDQGATFFFTLPIASAVA